MATVIMMLGGFMVGYSIGWPTGPFDPIMFVAGFGTWGAGFLVHTYDRRKFKF
jgi:hypothetical protein